MTCSVHHSVLGSRRSSGLAFAALLVGLAGCSSGGGTVPLDTSSPAPDGRVTDGRSGEWVSDVEQGLGDLSDGQSPCAAECIEAGSDLLDLKAGDAELQGDVEEQIGDVPDDAPSEAVGEIEEVVAMLLPGQHCNASNECVTGECAGTEFGQFCLPYCASGCPSGWHCAGDGPEARCHPVKPPSCWPCSHLHCPLTWCDTLGSEGEFCLAACQTGAQCPSGYTCEEAPTGLSFCRPPLPSCACAPSQIGYSVPCEKSNEFGTCTGSGICTEDGLLECAGPLPSLELCDNLDNDCDGLVDEDFPEKGKICDGDDEDLCQTGKWMCGPGGTGMTCSGEKLLTEVCDNKDNDCDGAVDEDFPAKGSVCGVSAFCGEGYWTCNVKSGQLVCKGVTPELEECDGVDNDCDGKTDEGFPDLDGNGFADCP